ncbi:dipeptide ABC superfamily ATP binding cassette transporter, membrane protein [Lentilactobacillus diolivorans DSM 14421]|uniref:Dipeptide ABC superfamily ATP binding cassette transporter, membrane protein n=1 Tax=Lentilactobacillus diolivorans DSM 14421 TaxID=1423739 RepID=A0A0R1SAP0_9LACO|nr:dipeptide ABC superfamily ATP binding cassette transporter, membrane protein [Lentilactobacillus diolivorans DSM 14421]
MLANQQHSQANVSIHRKSGFGKTAISKFLSEPITVIWLIVLILIVGAAIIGPLIIHYDPNHIDAALQNQAPSFAHFFGTDKLGRDLFVRTCTGLQVSLLVAIVSTILSIVFGTVYGVIMAVAGGWVDEVMMRIIEIFNSIPSLLITMILMAVLGNGIVALLFAIAITSWADAARQTRGLVMQLRNLDYVTAAKMLDTPFWRTTTRHFVPNMMSILILDIGQSIPDNIFAEASLSFLGLGLQPPNTSLGILISVGQDQMLQHPYQLYVPIIVLILLVLAFNIVGDGVRDALDPKYQDK